jgi:hypothetical protein
MSFSQWLSIAILVLPSLAATAQPTQPPLSPAQANASVPPSSYVSAFKDYRTAADEKASPDTVWRAANEQVLGEGGHVMPAGSLSGAPAPKADSASGRPAAQRPLAPQADPHAGHAGHSQQGK